MNVFLHRYLDCLSDKKIKAPYRPGHDAPAFKVFYNARKTKCQENIAAE